MEAFRDSEQLQQQIGYMLDGYLVHDHYSGDSVKDRGDWAHQAIIVSINGETEGQRNNHLHERLSVLARIINNQANLYKYPVEVAVRANFNRTTNPPLNFLHAVLTDRDLVLFFKAYYGDTDNNFALPDNFGPDNRETIGTFVNYERASMNLLFDLKFPANEVTEIMEARDVARGPPA